MPTSQFSQAIQNILDVAEMSLERGLTVPCLILLYAGIDTIANLERRVGEGNQACFVRWVDEFLLPSSNLGCTARDLYSARCGVLHTGTPDSDLTTTRRARRLLYASGPGRAGNLQLVAEHLGQDNLLVIHISGLGEGLKRGYASFLSSLQRDPVRLANAESRAAECLVDTEQQLVDAVAQAVRSG